MVTGCWPTTANTWHHVAYEYHLNQFTLYHDGVAIDPVATSFNSISNHSGANALGGINGLTMIADGGPGQINGGYYFHGMIDGIVFDNHAQDADWVTSRQSQIMPTLIPASLYLFAGGIYRNYRHTQAL